ncbi:MAG TPA: glycoside hydrolase family 97 protein [Bacteroidales bacterium]|nr:glycoside hydrolase family 97 protein [Bacteroidales bacterium]
MKTKIALLTLSLVLIPGLLISQKGKIIDGKSPDGNISLQVEVGSNIRWSLKHKGQEIISPSPISIILGNGEVMGANAVLKSTSADKINISFHPVNYRKSVITDQCNQLTLNFKGDYGIIFRIYNDAVAYRFFTKRKGELIIKNEEANFRFTADHKAFIPYMWDYRDGKLFNCSFESLYTEQNISQFRKDSLAFLPVLVDVGDEKKVLILEADLEDFPGMFLDINEARDGFKGVYAPYPLETYIKGINVIPSKRADYIAKTVGTRNFPWRAVFISEQDKELLNCDLVQKLASPGRLDDISWIKAGQVSWDWWNAMNISGVDFRAGMNTPSYKYYIDFASGYGIPYIILDGGWNVRGDLTKARPEINLEELVEYGRHKGVGLIVWASWQDILTQKEKAFPYYEKTGIKGMKIDFIDRDDQVAVASTYEIAKLAAEYHLLVDYHGVFKPAGLQRTYPNVVGFEGVKGMENVKWADEDVPRYDVTLPFIRNQAGPMDYTSGAMRNSNRANFRAINSMPMSKGTRVHQIAQYVIFEVPVQMLSDNPTIYMKEKECTEFITKVPTTFDETVPLDSKVAEYVAVARRKGSSWYIGAMTNWTPRDMEINLSFLGDGDYNAVIFRDGINADRDATDYRKEISSVSGREKLKVKLAPGGGWAARLEKR